MVAYPGCIDNKQRFQTFITPRFSWRKFCLRLCYVKSISLSSRNIGFCVNSYCCRYYYLWTRKFLFNSWRLWRLAELHPAATKYITFFSRNWIETKTYFLWSIRFITRWIKQLIGIQMITALHYIILYSSVTLKIHRQYGHIMVYRLYINKNYSTLLFSLIYGPRNFFLFESCNALDLIKP